VLDYIADKRALNVQALYDALRIENRAITKRQVADLVWMLKKDGRINLGDIKPATTLPQFLRSWERNLYFYVSLLVAFAAILAIYVIPPDFPFVILRWALGSFFVLFIPGYVAVEALFGFAEMDLVERIALSIGLSVALTMFVGLFLNYTSWGVTLTPLVISLTAITILLDIVALRRSYSSARQVVFK
jgi:uncharacterized membrane protein